MGSKMLYHVLYSDKPLEEIVSTIAKNSTILGGQITRLSENSIKILNGKENVQFGFAADFDSVITVNPVENQRYDVMCNISWKMNTLSWICFIVGFFVFGILWVIPLLYLFIDPTKTYNNIFFITANQIGGRLSPYSMM